MFDTVDPLQLTNSWPLAERTARFDLGVVHDSAGGPPLGGVGDWHCDLRTGALTWSDRVYRMFGLTPEIIPDRVATLRQYHADSVEKLERLRNHIIRHRRGFTLDVAIEGADAVWRWVRINAAVERENGIVTGVYGLKQDVTALYR